MAQLYGQYKNKKVFGETPEDILKQAGGEQPTEWKQFTNETWQPYSYQAPIQPTSTPTPTPTPTQELKNIFLGAGNIPYQQITGATQEEINKKATSLGINPANLQPTTAGMAHIAKVEEEKIPTTTEDLQQGQGETFIPPETTATNIVDSYTNSMLATLQQQRTTLENTYKTQLENTQKKLDEAQKKYDEAVSAEKGILEGGVATATSPFRENLEKAERERLKIEENYFQNQQLVNELDTLLTDIQAQVQAQKNITGLASIRDPRINKAIEDANSRVGVIEAVMASRNNQITVAENLIDRTTQAITADRQDQLTYYNALLSFYDKQVDTEGNKILTLTQDEKDMIANQTKLIENDLATTQANADYIKGLMLDPATAQIVAQSGVTLNDTPEQVSQKFANFAYQEEIVNMNNQMALEGYNYVATPEQLKGKNAEDLKYMTDSKGNSRVYYKKPEEQEWSEPYMLGGDYVQKNKKTGEIRTAVNVPKGETGELTESDLIRQYKSEFLAQRGQGMTYNEAIENWGAYLPLDYIKEIYGVGEAKKTIEEEYYSGYLEDKTNWETKLRNEPDKYYTEGEGDKKVIKEKSGKLLKKDKVVFSYKL